MNHQDTEAQSMLYVGLSCLPLKFGYLSEITAISERSDNRRAAPLSCATDYPKRRRAAYRLPPHSNKPHAPARVPARQKPLQSSGFTIIELLVVISLISMLIVLLFGAARLTISAARKQRAVSTAAALQTAITTYRHEYGKWPADLAIASGMAPTNGSDGNVLTIPGPQNYLVFDMLRASSAALNPSNTNNIHFVDDSAVLAENPVGSGTRIPRNMLPSSDGMIETGHPIVYQTRSGDTAYYSVTLWFELEKAEVHGNDF